MESIVVSIISATISTISVIVTVFFNTKNQKQYNRSLEPALSFQLVEYSHMLFLKVTNTGKSAAQDIQIKINSIENNGEEELLLDDIFKTEFEMYPGETTQGSIAFWGENCIEHTFPKVNINVKYKKHISKKYEQYTRTVIFNSSYGEKVIADVNMDLHDISSSMNNIARANIRTANYLDGHQVSPIDELNLLANRSLRDDLQKVKNENTESNIIDRSTTIEQRMSI